MIDARVVRTRAALHSAIIALASEKPVSSITVSELADRTQINRVTFYKHYTSVPEALAAALRIDMEPAWARLNAMLIDPSQDPGAAYQDGLGGVLDQIEKRRALYMQSTGSEIEGTVLHLIALQFTDSFRAYLAQRRRFPPPVPEVDTEIVAAFFAYGVAAAVTAWLRSGDPDRSRLMGTMIALAPDWWFPAHTA